MKNSMGTGIRRDFHGYDIDIGYLYQTHFRLEEHKHQSHENYSPGYSNWLKPLELVPLDSVKVVILGQDPYPEPGVADGLAFSTQSKRIPVTLHNIFRELCHDLDLPQFPKCGDLSPWAERGVLLLNTALTVGRTPRSHLKMWEPVTDGIIKSISDQKSLVVFILWGKQAQSKLPLIDQNKHIVIQSAHPSPHSATRGFFGSRPFSRANEYLVQHGLKPIDWKLLSSFYPQNWTKRLLKSF